MNRVNRPRILLLLATLLFSFLFLGWSKDWDQIRKDAEQIDTLKAGFVQEKHMKILSRPLISRGRFYYERPNSLRWEYLHPIRSILIMHGGTVSRYTRVKGEFRKDSGMDLQAMGVVMEEISAWLGGRFVDNADFSASLEPGRKILLTPRKRALSAVIKKIELALSERPGVIRSVTIHEGPDSFTRIVFEDVRVNEELAETVFQPGF